MIDKIIKHYRNFTEGDRLFSSKANSIEFYTNVHFIEKYIKSNSNLLELGAGHGTYSIYFSQNFNIQVQSTDVVPDNVKVIEERALDLKLDNFSTDVIDASNMQTISNQQFDIVLSLGPLAHLRTVESRRKSILECKRVVKRNGIVAFAYINRNFALSYYNKNSIFFTESDYDNINKADWYFSNHSDPFINISFYGSPEEMQKEIENCGFEIIKHISSDGLHTLIKDKIETMNEDQFSALLKNHINTAEMYSNLGASSHNLIIAKIQDS
jgi:ubiquinone/menaquinone biosynthesis C-methylase UbiE